MTIQAKPINLGNPKTFFKSQGFKFVNRDGKSGVFTYEKEISYGSNVIIKYEVIILPNNCIALYRNNIVIFSGYFNDSINFKILTDAMQPDFEYELQ